MIRIINSGCNGYMGHVVTAIAENDPDVKIVAGIDLDTRQTVSYPIYSGPAELYAGSGVGAMTADVIIDFSSPSTLKGLLECAVTYKIPLVLCTTGYTPEQLEAINNAAQKIPVFRSGNMSVGINLVADLVRRACIVLGEEFDIEIVERHHKRKVDAPSGTALLLADAASEALPYTPEYVFERESRHKPRGAHEIGISSVRGGTIVGVHDVIFAGQDEVIEIKHTAASRDVFAIGALKAAKFIIGKPNGLYSMKDVLSDGKQTAE